MSLLKEITDEESGSTTDLNKDQAPAPTVPDGWSIGHLAGHGLLLSCDGFQLKLDGDQLHLFYDIAESGSDGEVRDHNGVLVLVEPTDDGIVVTRTNDPVYPSGVVLDLETLKDIGIEQSEEEEESDDSQDAEDDPDDDQESTDGGDTIDEGVKAAYRRSGGKIKRGFRVTSGFRKGRVLASAASASKPRAKASTRMKLKIAARKHKVIRVLKSKRTRKKSLSKQLRRMNHT